MLDDRNRLTTNAVSLFLLLHPVWIVIMLASLLIRTRSRVPALP